MEHTNSKILTKRLTLSVVAACLISFCGLITETAVNIAFPKIMADFHVPTAMVQWELVQQLPVSLFHKAMPHRNNIL